MYPRSDIPIKSMRNIQELIFANDMISVSDTEETLQRDIITYQEKLKKVNLEI